jgi:hypothetical protein
MCYNKVWLSCIHKYMRVCNWNGYPHTVLDLVGFCFICVSVIFFHVLDCVKRLLPFPCSGSSELCSAYSTHLFTASRMVVVRIMVW